MVISLVSFGLFGPALSTTNINIVKWRYFVIFSPVFFCSLNWEFSYSNWEKNILFGIGNTTEYRSSKRAKKNPVVRVCLDIFLKTFFMYAWPIPVQTKVHFKYLQFLAVMYDMEVLSCAFDVI